MKKILAYVLIYLIWAISLSVAGMLDFRMGEVESELRYNFGVGLNIPYKGYNGYQNNPIFSAKLDFVRMRNFERDKMNYRISLDYFMMMAPVDTYGVTEDMFNISGSFIYKIFKSRKLFPYVGMGGGLYLDWVRVNTAALKDSYLYRFWGLNTCIGAEIDISERLLLIPEITGHGIFISGFNISTNLSFSLNLAFKPSKSFYSNYRR